MVCVVILFLQTWRAAIIPVVAIPVSLVGCFLVMGAGRHLVQHAVAVRPRAGDRHRGGRCDRRGGERRALSAPGHVAARSGAPDHGRGRQRADRDRAGAVRGVHPDGIHQRAAGLVLPAVRHHHRRGHGDLRIRLADAVAGAGGAAAEAAHARTAAHAGVSPGRAGAPVLRRLQLGVRAAVVRLRPAGGATGAHRRHHAGGVCRADLRRL